MNFANKEEHMQKLVDLIIEQDLSSFIAQLLIEEIIKRFSTFSSSPAVLKLFNRRMNPIQKKLSTMSKERADQCNYSYGHKYDDYDRLFTIFYY